MIESDWWKCDDPHLMLEFLRGKVSERKLLLFACACQRRIFQLRDDEVTGRQLVGELEAYADGLSSRDQLSASLRDSNSFDVAVILARDAALSSARMELLDGNQEQRQQAVLLREIIGNPFRPASVDPTCLSSAVVNLAQSIYDERAFDQLQNLADALDEAGCTNSNILDHCRQSETHVRGCWVIDLILGNK